MAKLPHPLPAGHVLLPAATIGSLSILMAAGLGIIGMLNRMNLMLADLVSRGDGTEFPKSLPIWSIWLAAILLAPALSFAILSVPGAGRRAILWITLVVLVAGWAPVLSLAAHAPSVAAPFVAVVWSGLCSMVYARNHRMAVDEKPSGRPHEAS